MNTLKIYIEVDGVYESIELHNEEKVSLNSSVQNIKDISKVFTDYTQSFSIPASPSNNKTFEHWYNTNIVGGFDASIRKDAKIELNNLPFKRGKLKLDKVIIKNGKPTDYKITFFGDITKLTDSFGDDTLNELDLSLYTHEYSHTTVKSKMNGDLDVIYPLISRDRDWKWNTYDVSDGDNPEHLTNESPLDIKWMPLIFQPTGFIPTGIQYTELRPAVRLNRIIEAIESKYGITFSDDFFNTTSHFNDLYMWGNRDSEKLGTKLVTDFQSIEIDQENKWKLEVFNNYNDSYEKVQQTYEYLELTITPLPTFENVEYSIKANGQQVDDLTGTQVLTSEELSDLRLEYNYQIGLNERFVELSFKSGEVFQFNAALIKKTRVKTGRLLTQILTTDLGNDNQATESGLMYLTDKSDNQIGALPKMKVKEFLDGLIKMYNLVIEPIDSETFRVQTLSDWYSDGGITDISEYVNKDNITVSRPELHDTISFQYEPTDTIIGKQFRDSSSDDSGYGDLKYEGNYDGKPLEIKVPFENIVGARLTDFKTQEITDVHVHKAIEINNAGETSSVKTKPFIFYNNPNYSGSSGQLQLNNAGTVEQLFTWNVASQFNSLVQSDINQSTNFNVEIDSFTLTQPPSSFNGEQASLYNNYWSDYISDLYNPNRRLFKYDTILPLNILKDIKLNDRIVIDDTRYLINNLKMSLTTGEVTFELLNDIYDNLDTSDVHASVIASASRVTCANPTVLLNGAASTGFDLTYSWSTSDGSFIGSTTEQLVTINSAGTYTLEVTDTLALTDTVNYTISDAIITPSVTITPSQTELTYTNPTITLTSSITSGYGYAWYTPDGNIISGATTSQCEVNSPGTYYLDVIQNNTGCSASDSQVITSGDLELPSIPDGIFASGITETTMTIGWTPSTDDIAVLNYDIYKDGVYYATTIATTQLIIGLTLDQIYQFKLFARDTSGNISPFSELYYQKTGSPTGTAGADGENAKSVKLTAPTYVLEYDFNGLNPSPSTFTIEAVSQNIGTPWFKFTGDGIVDDTVFSVGTGDTKTIQFTSPSANNDNNQLKVAVSDGNQIELAYDTITIAGTQDGTDGYTVVLSNDSHTLVTSSTGVVNYTGSGTDIIVYKGGTQLSGITSGTAGVGTFKLISSTPTDITVGTATAGTPLTIGNHSSMIADNAQIVYVLDLEGSQTVSKIQTLSKSIQGDAGASGTDSKVSKLTASSYVITYNNLGVETPSNQSITLTGSSQNHSGTVYYDFIKDGISKQNSAVATYTIPDGDEPIGGGISTYTLNTREGANNNPIVSTDSISIVGIQEGDNGNDGLSSMSVIIANEAHVLPTTNAGVVTYTGSGTKIYTYEGSTALNYVVGTPSTGQWTYTCVGVNITCTSPGTDNGTFTTTPDHSNMTANIASVEYTITGKRLDGTSFTIVRTQSLSKSIDGADGTNGIDGTDGSDGTDGKVNKLTSSSYVITYNSSGVETPSIQFIALTASEQNHVGTVYYDFLKDGISKQNSTSNTYTAPDGDEPLGGEVTEYTLNTREGANNGTIIATDSISIVGIQDAIDGTDGTDGTDGNDGINGSNSVSAYLSNDSHTLATTAAGVVNYIGANTNVYVYDGTTALEFNDFLEVPQTNGTWTLSAIGTDINVNLSGLDIGTSAYIYGYGNMTANNAKVAINIQGKTLDGETFFINKVQSLSKSIEGSDGADGNDGADGSDGLSAKSNRLNASSYVITYEGEVETPEQSITLTATQQNHVGTVNYQFKKGTVVKQISTSPTYIIPDGDEPSVNITDTWTLNTYENGVTVDIVATDTISIYGIQSGKDAYTVILTNDNHSLPTSSTGVVDYANSGTEIIVYKGTTKLTGVFGTSPATGQYSVTPSVVSGAITIGVETINAEGNTTIANHSSAGTTPVRINYLIGIGGTSITFDKYQSLSKTIDGTVGGDGVDGDDGKKTKSGQIYYQISQTNQPATPSASLYTFSTNLFSQLSSNWSTTPPTATGGEDYWFSSYNVTETTAGSNIGAPTFTSANKSFAFTELVTFTNLASTTGSTVINGGNITTGNIQSSNYIAGTSPYTTQGTLINLDNGSINTENFGVDSLGNGKFKGTIEGGTINIGDFFDVTSSGTLTATNANISGNINASSGSLGGWDINDPSIQSQQEYSAGVPRVDLNGTTGKMVFKADVQTYTNTGGNVTFEQTITIDPVEGKIEARHTGNGGQENGVAILDSNGVFCNSPGTQAVSSTTGIEIKGSIVGLGYGSLDANAFSGPGIEPNALVGVFGAADNTALDPAPSFGGYFFDLYARGMYLHCESVLTNDTTYNVTDGTVFLSCYNTSTCNVYLPSDPKKGRVIEIKRVNALVNVNTTGGKQFLRASGSSTPIGITDGYSWRFIWDGSYWMANLMTR